MSDDTNIIEETVNRQGDETVNPEAAPEEEPFAVNNTTVTDEMNKAVLTRVMKGPIITNTCMIILGLFSEGFSALVNALLGKRMFSTANIVELSVGLLLIVLGVYGLISVRRYINNAVRSASETVARRKTSFYKDKFTVEIAFEETEVNLDYFSKMKQTKTLLIFYFKGYQTRSDVYFVAKEGFENESQLEAVVSFFNDKSKTANRKKTKQ
ncbi:MAG: YcxB family protein [Clostridia bacterium]|nr:YcxB family protein [Clostridia bacterium]